jgi:very-short-patch-repair endonuclease
MALPRGRFPSNRTPPTGEWTSGGLTRRATSTRSAGGGEWTDSAAPDVLVADVAARQHGVVSLRQLHAAGLSEKAIRHRVAHGHMTRLHSGVYRVGQLTSPFAEPFAAVLACGPTAVLSHDAAAALHGIAQRRPGPVDVTVTAGRPRPRGVRVHRAALPPEERAERDGIAVTTAARALVDVAPTWRRRELEHGVEQAVVLGLAPEAELEAAARSRRRGAARLRRVLADLGTPSLTRSEAERRLLELIRSAQLPHPVANARVGRFEVDLLWPRERLVVEVDGFAFHSTRQAFERDRARDAALQLAGHRVIRITWRQLVRERFAVVATLSAALQPR